MEAGQVKPTGELVDCIFIQLQVSPASSIHHIEQEDVADLLCDRSRRAIQQAAPMQSFSKRLTSVGLGHWAPREFRRSATSFLSAAGVPLELIADVLGHDGTRMTGAAYRHAVSAGAGVSPMPEKNETPRRWSESAPAVGEPW